MIKTYSMLLEELSDYADIDNKIARYGPSYLSFEYALSYYGIH